MPIPGIRGMEHIGFTVPDIDEACDFFEKILGATVLYTAAKDFRADGTGCTITSTSIRAA